MRMAHKTHEMPRKCRKEYSLIKGPFYFASIRVFSTVDACSHPGTCPRTCGRGKRGKNSDFDFRLAFAALFLVTGFLFAAGANPVRLGGFAGHDAALRLDF